MRTSLIALTLLTAGSFAVPYSALAGDGDMKADGNDHMKHGMSAMAAEAVTLGDLTISAPFARATLPNQPVAGGFMTITNSGTEDDRLIAAASPAAGRMEIHEMRMDGDVMRMRELDGGLVIPAGETVTLEPGGYHIMFMDLAGPLAEGEMREVTLSFETAGDVTAMFPVVAREHGGGHMKHGDGEG